MFEKGKSKNSKQPQHFPLVSGGAHYSSMDPRWKKGPHTAKMKYFLNPDEMKPFCLLVSSVGRFVVSRQAAEFRRSSKHETEISCVYIHSSEGFGLWSKDGFNLPTARIVRMQAWVLRTTLLASSNCKKTKQDNYAVHTSIYVEKMRWNIGWECFLIDYSKCSAVHLERKLQVNESSRSTGSSRPERLTGFQGEAGFW